jgi:hypothetical protein
MRAYPELCYGPQYSLSVDLFNHGAHEGLWWGEDYAFCRNYARLAEEVWIVPDINLDHCQDDYVYKGNFHEYLLRQDGGSKSANPRPPAIKSRSSEEQPAVRFCMKRVLLTGGAGFIGAHIVEHLHKNTDWDIVILDRLTYAGNLDRLAQFRGDPRIQYVFHDFRGEFSATTLYSLGKIDYIIHNGAETHVDSSLIDPAYSFTRTS